MKKYLPLSHGQLALLLYGILLYASPAEAQLGVPDNSKTYSPQQALNDWTNSGQGAQAGKQYKSDLHEKADPKPSSSIRNGQNPPDHARGTNNESAGTDGDGKPIITKQIGGSNQGETAVRSAGEQTNCMFQSNTLSPQTMADRQPFWCHAGTQVSEKSKRNAIDGAVNATMRSIGNDLSGKGDAGVAKSGFHAQAGMPLTQSTLATLLGGIGDQVRQQVSNPATTRILSKGVQQIQNMQNADNQGNACRSNCAASFESMVLPLINVANENAGSACSSSQPFKTEANVIWMIQQMYKQCYVPMAVLLLLPGALLTQIKALISSNVLELRDDDTVSPFIGIIRAIIAIFLIPATQLLVSYSIDTGNALTEPVAQQIKLEQLMSWVNEQAYASDPKNNDGAIKVAAGAPQGKLSGVSSKSVIQERQSNLTVGVQNWMNSINNLMSQGLEILNGFQFIMMCYLFLMGPIAAALYAWPTGIGRSLFKGVFAGWLDGVIVLSLWKFWWCIILLCMAIRLQQGIDPTNQFEMYYFTAFMGILVVAPFQPFEFHPGEIVSQLLEKAQSGGGASGGGSGGGSKPGTGGGGGGGSSAPHGQSGPSPAPGATASSNQLSSAPGNGSHGNSPGKSETFASTGSTATKPIDSSAQASPLAGNVHVNFNPPPGSSF